MSLVLGVLLPILALAAAWLWRNRCLGFNCRRARHFLSVRRVDLRRPVTAVLLRRIDADALQQAEAWRPWLSATGQGDLGWAWRDILREAIRNSQSLGRTYEAYSLFLGRDLLGLLLLRTRGYRSRIPGDFSPIVYIEYVAVTPDARSRSPVRRYRDCGQALLEFALHRSGSLGYGGRLGLHSLPEAESFYRRAGFLDLGPDPREGGLRYFETPRDLVYWSRRMS